MVRLRLLLLLGVSVLFIKNTFAQFTNNGARIHIATGSRVLTGTLNVVNGNNGIVDNEGLLVTAGHITNAATLQGTGTWQLAGNWTNTGNFLAETSTVLFDGTGSSTVSAGGSPFHHLHLGKTSNNLLLASAVTALGNVNFLNNNNRIVCAAFDFTAGSAATVTGADSDNYFVTDGAGKLIRQSLGSTAFVFPVGADAGTYNPVSIAENGDPDHIGVRCMPQPLANGSSGAPLAADAVNAAWAITESNSGGSDLDVTAQWATTDELPGFVRTDCGIARYNSGADWDLPPANMGAGVLAGANTYTRSRSDLQPGILTVMDEAFMNRVLLAPRMVLQGPFNTTAMQMNDLLRTLAAFPLAAPATYGSGKFIHTGWQPSGGYNIAPSILTVTGNDAVIDWVFLWLKNPANPAVNLQTRVAILQKDGDVVDLDGVSPVAVPANAGNYIVALGHRNHLSVRMPNGTGLSLNESTATPYDFTAGMAQAFGNDPMVQVQNSPPIFALWGGNTSVNNTVRATGPPAINDYTVILSTLGVPTNVLTNVYSNSDVNMDKTVRVTGPPAINDYSKLLSILGTPTNIITEQQ